MVDGIIGVIFVFGLVALGIPIAFSLFLVGFFGIFFLKGFALANVCSALIPLGTIMGSELASVPLFMLVGSFALSSGVAADAFAAARRWVGRLPGGLGIATIAASAAFAACSGSSIAAAATMGKMCIPEMRKYGYHPRVATGTCAAGGLLATMIPPSGAFVLYGIAADESIGHLLIAGVFPGLIITFFFGLGLYLLARRNPAHLPISLETYTWKERFMSIFRIWGVIGIFSSIFFSIFFGIFTATEAAAIGSFVGMIFLFVRKGKNSWPAFKEACEDTATVTAMILFLVLGAFLFGAFVIYAGLPRELTQMILASKMSPYTVLTLIIITYLILGCFMDGAAMMLITIPIYHPIMIALGFNGIWFGVVVVAMLEVGMLTPPFGLAVYVIGGVAPDVSLPEIFRGAMMFVLLEILAVVLVCIWPQIALWLPSQMMK